MQGLASELAGLLGFSLSREKNYAHYVELVGPVKNAKISVRVLPPSGKVSIRGQFPDDYSLPYGEKSPEISVSLSKSAEQIAKDIERRLFPEYEKMLDVANKRVDEHRAFEYKIANAARDIAATVGGVVEGKGSNSIVRLYHSSKLPETLGEIDIHGDDVVFDGVRVSYDEAEVMLKTLIKMRAGR